MSDDFALCLDASGLRWWSASSPARLPTSGSETAALVFAAGYVSNAAELTALTSSHPVSTPTSTADWIALAFREYGDLLPRFVAGQYCACVVHTAANEALLLQDALGLCSLFYDAVATRIVVSTQLSDVLGEQSTPSLDLGYFAECFARGGLFTPRTPYQGIRRLVHGRCIRWTCVRSSSFTPWSPTFRGEADLDDESYDARLRDEVDRAVARALPAATNKSRLPSTWCEFSAGLDSTTVLYSALKQGAEVDAFSWLSASNTPGSDALHIRQVAPLLPCNWRHLNTDMLAPYSLLPPAADEPRAAIVTAKREAYASLLRQHSVEVLLTGMGGDLTFGSVDVTPHHLADGLLAVNPFRLWTDLSAWIDDDPRGRGRAFWLWSHVLPDIISHVRPSLRPWDRSHSLPAWLRSDTVRRHAPDDAEVEPPIPRSLSFGRAMLWREAYMQASMLARDNRGAPTSIRHPLLDLTLLEFALALPHRLRSSAGHDRILQRRAFASRLPQAVLERTIKGTAQAALDQGLRDSVSWLALLRQAKYLQDLDFVDPIAWRHAIDRATFGIYDSASHFTIACEFEAWLAFRSTKLRRARGWLREPAR